ncbi:MAG: hypothetical protein Q4A31_07795 [Corynebacterium sp.]|uniref:hypothetical protein n=1 Tax=Corynebacterium sp. TaxID=1720 RepID=UPI0026DC1838|nr:hypothetical protein [Corynebacterium sp.]MDO4761805.1 hypothetical protein [Corynebacterium sp.]
MRIQESSTSGRRLATVALTLVGLSATLVAPASLAAQTYPIWVGNIQVTDENKNDVKGDGTVSFNAETSTLTLNKASLNEAREVKSEFRDASAIYSNLEKLTLDIQQSNSIDLPRFNGNTIAIMHAGSGPLTVTGQGKLNVTTAEATSTNSGLHSNGPIVFDGPELTLKPGVANSLVASGIFSTKDISINSGTLTVAANRAQQTSYGIYASGAVHLRGGSVSAQGFVGNAADTVQSFGIRADNLVTIDDASVTARGTTRAFHDAVALSKDVPVRVNTRAAAQGAQAWNMTDPLGGANSPYLFVQVNSHNALVPPSSSENSSWLTPLLAVIGAIGGLAALIGAITGIFKAGLIPAQILPQQVRMGLGI